MSKPFVFISCGQFTPEEKRLGLHIAHMVRTLTGLEAFFAEQVQDLNGLDTNILSALRDCVGFIAVLHPRGTIERPDSAPIVRASVWIEQEIAIATYIQRVEKRDLPIIAFKHKDVGREGLREFLHLNPIEFTNEGAVLFALPERLLQWKSLAQSGGNIRLQLTSTEVPSQDNHPIRKYRLTLVNDTNERISQYNGKIWVPGSILKHWNSRYLNEVKIDDPHRRCFRIDEEGRGIVTPHDNFTLFEDSYCTTCALEAAGGIGALVSEAQIEAKIWINGREYTVAKTLKQIAMERGR